MWFCGLGKATEEPHMPSNAVNPKLEIHILQSKRKAAGRTQKKQKETIPVPLGEFPSSRKPCKHNSECKVGWVGILVDLKPVLVRLRRHL